MVDHQNPNAGLYALLEQLVPYMPTTNTAEFLWMLPPQKLDWYRRVLRTAPVVDCFGGDLSLLRFIEAVGKQAPAEASVVPRRKPLFPLQVFSVGIQIPAPGSPWTEEPHYRRVVSATPCTSGYVALVRATVLHTLSKLRTGAVNLSLNGVSLEGDDYHYLKPTLMRALGFEAARVTRPGGVVFGSGSPVLGEILRAHRKYFEPAEEGCEGDLVRLETPIDPADGIFELPEPPKYDLLPEDRQDF